jgi:glycosyltransferase involved in cell wall biosynthesis
MTRRILFVGMQMSTHTARWINQLADEGWDLHLFPMDHQPVIPEMRGVTVHQPWQMIRPRKLVKKLLSGRRDGNGRWYDVESDVHPNKLLVKAIYPIPMLSPFARVINKVLRVRFGESAADAPLFYGPHVLARLIRRLKPDLIHSMEFQHCGYNVLRAKELSHGEFPPWLATNWGSDIYYFRQFEDHRTQIARLLRNIDFYSCECHRDVRLARELGMKATAMPVMPNTGGVDLEAIEKMRGALPASRRGLIMVKGYQHFAGRALTALDAVERCASLLDRFRIVVFSPSLETMVRATEMRDRLELNIEILPYANHAKMLRLFSKARVYLGVSISDAISTSMLEAMVMGAFPIQTNTSCCDEWIVDGQSGFVIPPDDVEVIADRLRRALTDDTLVDAAAEENWTTVCDRLDSDVQKRRAIALYDEIFSSLNPGGIPVADREVAGAISGA